MLKPNQSWPVLVAIEADNKELADILFADANVGRVDGISYLCKTCLRAVQRLVCWCVLSFFTCMRVIHSGCNYTKCLPSCRPT